MISLSMALEVNKKDSYSHTQLTSFESVFKPPQSSVNYLLFLHLSSFSLSLSLSQDDIFYSNWWLFLFLLLFLLLFLFSLYFFFLFCFVSLYHAHCTLFSVWPDCVLLSPFFPSLPLFLNHKKVKNWEDKGVCNNGKSHAKKK